MEKEDLIALYYAIETELEKRQALGEFDANASHINFLTEAVMNLTAALINSLPDSKVKMLPKRRKKK